MLFLVFWSECRDSNSRPLEPHSSAIPNFATPGYFPYASAPKYISIEGIKCQVVIFIFILGPNVEFWYIMLLGMLRPQGTQQNEFKMFRHFFPGAEYRDSILYCVDAVQPASRNTPQGYCMEWFESLH